MNSLFLSTSKYIIFPQIENIFKINYTQWIGLGVLYKIVILFLEDKW